MNKLIIALSLACASACVFADVGATPKTDITPWFNATAGETLNHVTVTPSDIEVKGGKYVIDSEPTAPVTFTAEEFSGSAKDMVEVSINLDTAIVPSDARGDLSGTDAKVAFAASEDNDVRVYYAWVGSWIQLSGATPSQTDGTSYNLLVTFDNREATKKVQFKVDGTVLKDTSGNEWLAYSPVVSTTMSIDLVGSGNVASLIGSQLTVTSEVVVVDGGTIEIKEADVKKFNIPSGTSKDAFFAGMAKDKIDGFGPDHISVGAAYALGLVADKGTGKMEAVDGGELKAHAVAQANNTKGIELGLNVNPPKGTGATITYAVYNGDTKVSDECVIPKAALEAGLKTFKIRATVTPKAAE